MTYSEPVRNQKPNRLGTGNRTEPNRFLNYIPRNRTEPNREPEIHQFLETETEPNPPCIYQGYNSNPNQVAVAPL